MAVPEPEQRVTRESSFFRRQYLIDFWNFKSFSSFEEIQNIKQLVELMGYWS